MTPCPAPSPGDRVRYLAPLTAIDVETGEFRRVHINDCGTYVGPVAEGSMLPANYHDTTATIGGREHRVPVELLLVDVIVPIPEVQRRRVHALLRERAGVQGKARFPVLTQILGREITTTRDLTTGDAARIIDALLAAPAIPKKASA